MHTAAVTQLSTQMSMGGFVLRTHPAGAPSSVLRMINGMPISSACVSQSSWDMLNSFSPLNWAPGGFADSLHVDRGWHEHFTMFDTDSQMPSQVPVTQELGEPVPSQNVSVQPPCGGHSPTPSIPSVPQQHEPAAMSGKEASSSTTTAVAPLSVIMSAPGKEGSSERERERSRTVDRALVGLA